MPSPTKGRPNAAPGAATITEYVDAAYHPDFFVQLRFVAGDGNLPKRRVVVAKVEGWLQQFGWDQLASGRDGLRETEIQVGDWVIGLRAHPRAPTDRGDRDAPTVRVFPEMTAWTDEVMAAVVAALDAKASRYGDLDAPYIVAAWVVSSVAHEEALTATLFGARLPLTHGRHDGVYEPVSGTRGLWTPDRPRRDRPSAVLLAGSFDFNYNAVARRLPRLFHNPWAVRPCDVPLPYPSTRIDPDTRSVVNKGGTISPSTLFELPETWPGTPFIGRTEHGEK